jgi:hypothetical protein
MGVQPGLELEEVQMPPRAAQQVVLGWRRRTALRARQQRPWQPTSKWMRRLTVSSFTS